MLKRLKKTHNDIHYKHYYACIFYYRYITLKTLQHAYVKLNLKQENLVKQHLPAASAACGTGTGSRDTAVVMGLVNRKPVDC